jgi:tetratricopeptide (TPR) repeat protein
LLKLIARLVLIFTAACLLLLPEFSCSTKKNKALNRGFHNMSSYYNGYFNAREILKETLKKMDDDYADDYSKVLPMWTYGDPKYAKTIIPDMEKILKKCTKVIERHSMLIKGEEHCKWIDETYLLIGKQYFYKHEYFAGVEVFEFIIGQYKKQPTKYDALLWLSRTYNEIGAFTRSQSYLDMCKSDKAFPYRLNGELAAVTADFYLKQNQWEAASKELNKAISYTKKRKEKARFNYIMAQIHEKMNKPQRARYFYAQVIKLNPKYELVFYSKIRLAMLYDVNDKGSQTIKAQLTRMLKDIKNEEYYDQIYYALAEIADKQGDQRTANDLLKKSIRVSTKNKNQKGLSAFKLADNYFSQPDYPLAGAYYDTAASNINKQHPDYDMIVAKKEFLSRLISNYRIIAQEDSLQRMAKMDEKDRDRIIEKLIDKAKEDERRMLEEAESGANQNNALNLPGQSGANQGGSGSTWYFYNPATLSFGFSEFSKRWGTRKLEDNWRRSNKQAAAGGGDDPTAEAGKSGEKKIPANQTKEYYLKNLPLGDSAYTASVDKSIEAYYDLSLIYKEQLMNDKKAAEKLEALIDKYPNNKYKLPSYYQLYRIYTAQSMPDKAEKYKNILLNQYPDSDYAMLIKNPQMVAEKNKKLDKEEDFYELTYQMYEQGKYMEAYERCMKAEESKTNPKLAPKFALLKALCIGRLRPLSEFESALMQVVAGYQKDPVSGEAQQILNYIRGMAGTLPMTPDSTKTPFKEGVNKEHYCIIIANTKGLQLQPLLTSISNFNTEFYESSGLNTTNMPFGKDKMMVTIRSFSNKKKAMDYFITLRDAGSALSQLTLGEYFAYPITKDNYTTLFKMLNPEDYYDFFIEFYREEEEDDKAKK